MINQNLEFGVSKLKPWCFLTLLVLPCSLYAEKAEVHEEVQTALDYQMPLNDCKKPKEIEQMSAVLDRGGEGDVTQSDIDSYTMDRLLRKQKRWESCVQAYKDELLADLATLGDSAQYGLTSEQATSILQKMADIQSVVMTVDGIKPVDTDRVIN